MEQNILTIIDGLEDMRHLQPASQAAVEAAQQALGVQFAPEYQEYVLHYGVISARGIELTGVTTAKRLDVVAVTRMERELNDIPKDMYVIENAAIDGIVILQNSAGEVFSAAPTQPVRRVCASLSEYIARSNF